MPPFKNKKTRPTVVYVLLAAFLLYCEDVVFGTQIGAVMLDYTKTEPQEIRYVLRIYDWDSIDFTDLYKEVIGEHAEFRKGNFDSARKKPLQQWEGVLNENKQVVVLEQRVEIPDTVNKLLFFIKTRNLIPNEVHTQKTDIEREVFEKCNEEAILVRQTNGSILKKSTIIVRVENPTSGMHIKEKEVKSEWEPPLKTSSPST